MSRVLVTGASGFVGQPALRALAERGHELHAVGRSARESDEVHWHASDLLKPGAASDLIDATRPERLVHLAWLATPSEFWTSPENREWVRTSRELLNAFGEAGGERVVVAGSCAEYDWSSDADCREGRTPLRPSTPYGKAKLELSGAAEDIAERTGFSMGWARLFMLFGPGEHPERLVASVARHVLAGQPAPCSAGTQLRDFLFVDDVADALAALLDSDVEGPVNIGSGEAIAIADLVERVAAAAGGPELLRLGALPARPDDPPRLVADIERLTEAVGWHAPTTLEEGIARTVDWWRDHERSADTRR